MTDVTLLLLSLEHSEFLMSQVDRIQKLLDVLCDLIYEVLQSRNFGYNIHSSFQSESTCTILMEDVEP